MSIKLIIWIPGRVQFYGHKRREYNWSAEHGCFIHGGKEYTPEEFNKIAEQAIRRSEDMHPCVKALISADVAAPVAPVIPIAPVATITAAHEITEEEALTTLMRLRPDLIKKKPGRKPDALRATA